MQRDDWAIEDFITYEVLIILEARIEKSIEIAINLLNAGVSPEIISKCVGLSLEEIEELPRYEGRTY
jgi:hypothetical protein